MDDTVVFHGSADLDYRDRWPQLKSKSWSAGMPRILKG
jgi:hypothetical protein